MVELEKDSCSYSYSYSLLHPIARASVKDERRNRHDKTGAISEILCICKLNHWQDIRYSLTETFDLRLSRGTEFKTEKQNKKGEDFIVFV